MYEYTFWSLHYLHTLDFCPTIKMDDSHWSSFATKMNHRYIE